MAGFYVILSRKCHALFQCRCKQNSNFCYLQLMRWTFFSTILWFKILHTKLQTHNRSKRNTTAMIILHQSKRLKKKKNPLPCFSIIFTSTTWVFRNHAQWTSLYLIILFCEVLSDVFLLWTTVSLCTQIPG